MQDGVGKADREIAEHLVFLGGDHGECRANAEKMNRDYAYAEPMQNPAAT